jgi:hypothetical protein
MGKPRSLTGAFFDPVLIVMNWGKLVCHVDVVCLYGVRWFGGLTGILGEDKFEVSLKCGWLADEKAISGRCALRASLWPSAEWRPLSRRGLMPRLKPGPHPERQEQLQRQRQQQIFRFGKNDKAEEELVGERDRGCYETRQTALWPRHEFLTRRRLVVTNSNRRCGPLAIPS